MPQKRRNRDKEHGQASHPQVEVSQSNGNGRFADIQDQDKKADQTVAGSEGVGSARVTVAKRVHIQTNKELPQPNGKWQRAAKKSNENEKERDYDGSRHSTQLFQAATSSARSDRSWRAWMRPGSETK